MEMLRRGSGEGALPLNLPIANKPSSPGPRWQDGAPTPPQVPVSWSGENISTPYLPGTKVLPQGRGEQERTQNCHPYVEVWGLVGSEKGRQSCLTLTSPSEDSWVRRQAVHMATASGPCSQ